jgi:hypothetical protein
MPNFLLALTSIFCTILCCVYPSDVQAAVFRIPISVINGYHTVCSGASVQKAAIRETKVVKCKSIIYQLDYTFHFKEGLETYVSKELTWQQIVYLPSSNIPAKQPQRTAQLSGVLTTILRGSL